MVTFDTFGSLELFFMFLSLKTKIQVDQGASGLFNLRQNRIQQKSYSLVKKGNYH